MKKVLLWLFFFVASSGVLQAQGWVELGTGSNALNPNYGIFAICTDTGGIVYAGGGFNDSLSSTLTATYVARWDGVRWTHVGVGANPLFDSGAIYAMCVDPHHNLYVAGALMDSNGYYCVAKWNGVSWSELGTGSSALKANDLINTMCIDQSGNIYVAGMFTDGATDTEGNNYVAMWNGSNWTELGTGDSSLSSTGSINYVNTITADRTGNIYASGNFWNTGVGYWYVAKWNGFTWSEMGTGDTALNPNGDIMTLCTDSNGNIYAAGYFTDGATSLSGNNYVAKWNGTDWTELGVGANALESGNYGIFSICTDRANNIYAAGYLNGGEVAVWNGDAWQYLGVGASSLNANDAVWTLSTDSSGYVYAAGSFTDSTNSSLGHSYVAMFNSISAGIPELGDDINRVKVYPIPAGNEITIEISEDLIGNNYTIFDMTGRQVISGKLETLQGLVDISKIVSGTYLLRIDGNTDAFMIVKE